MTSVPVYGEVYRRAYGILGVKWSIELAILTLELPLHLPLVRLKGLLGLIPGGNGERYNHKLRICITSFVMTLYMNAKMGVSVSDKVIKVVYRLPRGMTLCRLHLMTLKGLRIAYLMTVKPLASGW